MSMRVKAALVIMLIFLAVTTANYFSSIIFTTQSITDTMEQELSLALDIADTVVATQIVLLKSNAETVAERLMKCESAEEMIETMAAQIEEFNDFISLTVYDGGKVFATSGAIVAHDALVHEDEFIQASLAGTKILASPHHNEIDGSLVMHVFIPMGPNKILSATIPGMFFSELLAQYRLWQSGSIFIVDAEGTFVANYRSDLVTEQRNFIEEAESNPEIKSAGDFYLEMISSNEPGSGRYNYEDKERLCVYKNVTNSLVGWRIGVVAPLVESPQNNVRRSLLLAALAFLSIGAVLSIFISSVAVKPFLRIEAQNHDLEELNETVQTQAALILDDRERIKLLLDATPLACRLWNRDYKVFECNEETVKLYGLADKREFMDKVFDLSPEFQPDGQPSREKTISTLKKVFEEGGCVFEWTYQTLDGVQIPCEVTLERVRYGDDYVIAGYTRDLREHKKMMEAIERRDDLLYTGNSTAEVLLSIVDEANMEASLIEGMELVGRSVDADRVQIWRNEMFDGELYFVHTYEWLSELGRQKVPVPAGLKYPYADKPRWKEMFMRGECVNGPVSSLSPDDREFLIAYEMKSIVIIPIFLQDQFWGFFSVDDCHIERTFTEDEIRIMRSVSLMMASVFDRGAQAARIREANDYTELLIEAMPFACNLWDSDMNLFKCNMGCVRMFEIDDKSEFIEHFSDFSPEFQPDGTPSAPQARRAIQKAFDEGVYVQEWMHQTKDGTPLPAEVTLVRVTHGSEYVVAAYVRDLREQKRMMEEINEMMVNLHSANAAKSDFLARMSHEMRTPLNAIIGLSELVLEDETVGEDARLNIENVSNSGATLLNTVNDILDISRIEAGRLELVPVKYDLPSLINDTVTQSVMHIGEKPIKFILDVEKDLPVQLFGDDLRIKQILNNLLSNAFKYTNEGFVELGVRWEREGADKAWMKVWVKDSGIGIRREDKDKLFEEFVKVDEKSNRHIMGTGLGLPITKKMAELMDGTISVESEFGKGSTFTVRLLQDFVTDEEIGPEVVENLKSFRYSDQKRRKNSNMVRIKMPYANVLVVDDTMTNLDVAKGLMKPYGMHVDCVTGGEQAINAIRDEKVRYSAILMDHMMPGMDGVEAAKRIRAIDSDYARTVPIIACTANAIAGSSEMFLANGFQDFISKPIDIVRLDEILRSWVRDKELEKVYFDREVSVGGEIIPDARVGGDRRGAGRRSGFERRALGRIYNEIDIAKGIERFGGDRDTYMEILASFAVNTKPLIEQISRVNGENLADYAIVVHGIKGSSRSIFAEALGNQAEELEKAAKDGDLVFVQQRNGEFLETLEKFISGLEKMLNNHKPEKDKPVKGKPDDELLKKLLPACESFDMGAVNGIVAEIEKYEYDADDGLAAWIRENAVKLNYAQIAERLSGLS